MFEVTAAAVQVQVGGRVHLVHRGETLPEGVPEDVQKALTAKRLIKKVAKSGPTDVEKAAKVKADAEAKAAEEKAAVEAKAKADADTAKTAAK